MHSPGLTGRGSSSLETSQGFFPDLQLGVAGAHDADVAGGQMGKREEPDRPLDCAQPGGLLLAGNALQQQLLYPLH